MSEPQIPPGATGLLDSIDLDAAVACVSDSSARSGAGVNSGAVAVVGIACRLGQAESLADFWTLVRQGIGCVRDLPASRRNDVLTYLRHRGAETENLRFLRAGYLSDVDKFDHEFFGLSPREAALIDPHHRLLLQTAWSAFEDAGYGGRRLRGSQTGIFIGHSSDFGDDYRQYIRALQPDAGDIVVAGTVKSLMAGRLAYLLDLHGPAVLVDTACSSSLVAVQLACAALRRGDCRLAVVGSTKIDLMPVADNDGTGTVELSETIASDAVTRTFDDSSTGTVNAEGTAAVVLKPLEAALRDRDRIYAVIRGAAINQNGRSVGLTAPNSAAQKAVIEQSLRDADVPASSIGYVEAHGTATRLGDPIEVNAIQRAFEEQTSRKQFCAIGSLKTNLGHLDHVAGIAGLIKAIAVLGHAELPPTLNFVRPNRKIPFVSSPVYVNDRLRPWPAEDGAPRRCGVSAFGLSGTNCHVVLEQAPPIAARAEPAGETNLLVLSARNPGALRTLAGVYQTYLEADPAVSLGDLAGTAATGRDHFACRAGLVFADRAELLDLLRSVQVGTAETARGGLHMGRHRVFADPVACKSEGDIGEEALALLSREANTIACQEIGADKDRFADLDRLAAAYARGADVDWAALYPDGSFQRLSLPSYPFAKTRCWVEPLRRMPVASVRKSLRHPLLDACSVKTKECTVFEARLSSESHWVLAEHGIDGRKVLPGTAFVEMVREAVSLMRGGTSLRYSFRDLSFVQPCDLGPTESRDLRVVIMPAGDDMGFSVVSRRDGSDDWTVHAEGTCGVHPDPGELGPRVDLDALRTRLSPGGLFPGAAARERGIELGPRWAGCPRAVHSNGKDEFLIEFALPDEFRADLDAYRFHPALMDCAINGANYLVDSTLVLPFFYRELNLSDRLPARVFSHIRSKDHRDGEIRTFDVSLLSPSGELVARGSNYSVKRALSMQPNARGENRLHEVVWKEIDGPHGEVAENQAGRVLLLASEHPQIEELQRWLRARGADVVRARQGLGFERLDGHDYRMAGTPSDWESLFQDLATAPDQIVFAWTYGEAEDPSGLEGQLRHSLWPLIHLLRTMVRRKIHPRNGVRILTDWADSVLAADNPVLPAHTAMVALGKVVRAEYEKLGLQSADCDHETKVETIAAELARKGAPYHMALRAGRRHAESLIPCRATAGDQDPLRHDGVHLITGGLGGLGLEIGRHLASRGASHIVLVSRSGLVEQARWDDILAGTSPDTAKLRAQIAAVRAIEVLGARVICRSADVADLAKMREALSGLPTIDTVVHAAGVAGEGFLGNKSEAQIEAVLRAKTQGTLVLERVLSELGHKPRWVLFSSATTLSADLGQSDYAAANAFLDGYAMNRHGRGWPVVSLRWPAWAETGMAHDFGAAREDDLFRPLRTQAALELFDQAVQLDKPGVVVGELNADYVARHEAELPIAVATGERPKQPVNQPATAGKSGEVQLLGKETVSEVERRIGACWARVLGLEVIDLSRTFYECGGNSIFAVQVLREIEKDYRGLIDITDIFALATIEKLAAHIERQLQPKTETPQVPPKNAATDIADVLARLSAGTIDPEEANRLLSGS
jgi:acyl transferase domain-containing protein/acyl carrier protein